MFVRYIIQAAIAFIPLFASGYSLDYIATKAIKTAFVQQTPASRSQHSADTYSRHTVVKGSPGSDCSDQHAFGSPVALDDRTMQRSFFLCRIGYASMYDPTTKTPRWVAQRITAQSIEGSSNRKKSQFEEDNQIPSKDNVRLSDYKGSGVDKGHLAPAGDFKFSQDAMNQSFLLTNIVPQDSEHNRTIWANLEGSVRELAARRGELYVITGPIFTPTPDTIGRGVWVPYAMFKVVIDAKRKEMTAFIIKNDSAQGEDPARFQVTVRDVERATGLNFNPNLNRSEADRMEVGGGDWVIPKVRVRFKN